MALRWQKEWIPLVSQQMRVRNLTQILAYNLYPESLQECGERPKFFFTLHLTSKSAPFYTSDHATGPNPRWIEIDFKDKAGLSSSSFVICIWQVGLPDKLIFTWGVCLSGLQLAPLDQDLSKVSSTKTLVFFIHGYRFVPPTKDQILMRLASATVNSNDVKLSYPVNQLRRLKTYQFKLAEETAVCESLGQEVQRLGPFPPSVSPVVAAGNRYHYHQLQQLCENLRLKMRLLKEEKSRKEKQVEELKSVAHKLAVATELKRANLQKTVKSLEESSSLEDSKLLLSQVKETTTQTWSKLVQRRQELISQLKYIYPISIDPEGLAKICGVKLLRSDELNSQDEASSSVALGFAAHATVMVASFLDVPLRYPIQPAGSRAKIWDVVASKLPDSEREFPLFLKGRDAIQFYYAVYLLNKNIAQLKYYTGFSIRDLRTTLHNLRELLYMKSVIIEAAMPARSLKSAPVTSSAEEEQLPKRNRLAVEEHIKSASSMESVDNCFLEPPSQAPLSKDKESATHCSLDEGLDIMSETTSSFSMHSKIANNSDPNLRQAALKGNTFSPKEAVSNPQIQNISTVVKLRTQSECVAPKSEVSKEKLPTCNSLDNLFANVANRTEALASKSGSFNLVKSRPVEKS
ncbi:UV radiation resistance-associated gene protein isoform X2 [Neocloeon triangulifer]|uniref:UV radiation resistance-associated gene protein isoform X2 n=1 Tax=Neocloeon triangulifer TaxID=2078957 RepID=UPI00286EB6E0|nr:UV radiation resistance-associated gene protein isoform X2 [Neocloeon triangulifer]